MGDDTVVIRTVLVDGRVAGNVMSLLHEGQREVGYWIGREHWGRGVATSAMSLFLDQVRERPLYARVATRNVASIRVLEKCGFAVVGRARAQAGDVKEVTLRLGPGTAGPGNA
jgi:RimJ/RimL family protein N-acetyltransferase